MYATIAEIKTALKAKVSVVEIVQSYLDRIENHEHLNAFNEVFTDSALFQAKVVQEKINSGTFGKLAGVVVGIKDNICYKGHQVGASSKILEGFESIYTATALQRLIDEDAIIIGRLNCDEFAMGSSNEKSAYGPVLNNLNPEYVPGGSSGGSAVAVSARLCTVSLGSDTGGSVRQPASWTGTYGIKPSYGRISRYGLIAYASSFDQIGTFTNNLEDAKLLYDLMHGPDEKDSTTLDEEFSETSVSPIKFGLLMDCFDHPGIDPEIKSEILSTVEKLKEKGISVVPIRFPYLDYIVPVYYILTTAEASSNLSRFDGVHFGYRSSTAVGVEQTYVQSRSEGFGREVKRRIMTGTFVLSSDQFDAYYTKGMKVRRILKNHTEEIFNQVDCLILPTTPTTAFKLGEVTDAVQMYLQDIFTVHANLTGNPAASVPFKNHSNGMPYGIQLMTGQCKDETLFKSIEIFESLSK